MGKIFELISDKSLEKLDDYYVECHVCNNNSLDLYQFQGEIKLEKGEIDDEIYAVCAKCIKTKKLKHINDYEYIEVINNYLKSKDLSIDFYSELREKLISKYQQTPDIPLFTQYEDRPLCCNDITEFIGQPENEDELIDITKKISIGKNKLKKKLAYLILKNMDFPT